MTKVELTPAFLIHRRPYRETSLLLDFFTRNFGKIRLLGKGIRKSKSNIQMFQQLNISFGGRGALKTLTHWEVDDSPRNLRSEALIVSIYANELVSRLLQNEDVYVNLFAIYQKFIAQIGILEGFDRHWLLRIFENNLLKELGYGVDFSLDIAGKKIDKNAQYEYRQQAGFEQNSTGKISGKLIQQLLVGALNDKPDLQQLKVCRNLNRARISPLLDGKPLHSRSLFFTE